MKQRTPLVSLWPLVIVAMPFAPVMAGTGLESGVAEKLDDLVHRQIDAETEDPIHNAVLLAEKPGYLWQGAAGLADGKAEVMTAEHQFKTASIGKLFTAVIVLQLMEEGRLGLADTLGKYLEPQDVDLDSLHVLNGSSYGHLITIGQLLAHTSGIRDYMEDPRFISDVLANPNRQWSPAAILQQYFDYGTNRNPVFPPGEGYAYSDPNYVLLGMIIERVTGSNLQDQYRQRIFDPLEMDSSYLEFYEKPRGKGKLSHAYFGQLDISEMVNTSFDWAGGGVVSTCRELNVFIRALFNGRLFRNRDTLSRMLAAADRGLGGEDYDYGLGIMKRNIAGLTFYGHGGAYDCDLFYCPEQDISVCMSLNQMNTHGKRDAFLSNAVEILTGQR